ncbi:unnamed protein product [Aspergillus oryzae RIB40]|uniref:DNA, SC005 n=2 Tax=Aspergillus subgen. Circumdati TaxID=2720871 RepID=Q2UQX0_ASPOR|nr:unnamed protein product [Aspergillus oryzae RIB40]BAE56045.1 unnamed protein product [Aspergillus oryzae RIB40]
MPHYHIQHRTTALTLASKRRCTDIVKLLLKTRFDVSARLQGKSAIQLVARYDYAEVIALLLDAGAEVGLSDLLDVTCSGSTAAVHLAVRHDHPEIGYTPMAFAIGLNQEKCIKYGANIEFVSLNWTERRENSLWCAIDYNKAHLIPLLFQHRSNIEAEAYECKRLLHRAAMQGNVAALETLLTSGAKKNARYAWEQAALHHAALEGATVAILTLLR